jgi:hypothetical protein
MLAVCLRAKLLKMQLSEEVETVEETYLYYWFIFAANLSTLKRHFPYSLSSSILLANLCWEFILTWHRNVDELDALRAAVKCLQTVPSPHLREGKTLRSEFCLCKLEIEVLQNIDWYMGRTFEAHFLLNASMCLEKLAEIIH